MESGEEGSNGRQQFFWGSAASLVAASTILDFNKQIEINQQNPLVYGEPTKRLTMKGSTGGEIVQVQGGHIVRATGRKDRHSKVYTAKGPRDRRVRLSAHTAIQFYDVQDRLGYDRPSKAVDWLIKKAKSAIDKLAELPPWHPMDADHNAAAAADAAAAAAGAAAAAAAGANDMVITEQSESSGYSPFMESLFPISSSTASSMNFQSYPSSGLISRPENTDQDLGLSLHSFQDPDFSGPGPVGYEGSFQRMMGHNRGGGFSINPPPLPLLGQETEFSQRGTLQSRFVSSVRAWNDLAMEDSSSNRTQEIHQSFLFGSRFAHDGLMPGFGIPARIHGEEERSMVSERHNSSSSPHSQH